MSYTLLIAVLLVAGMAYAQDPAIDAERGVTKTVQLYFDGLKNNDPELLKKAFHPEAKLFSARENGELYQLTQETLYTRFQPGKPKMELEVAEIRRISIAETAAHVETRVVFNNTDFTDYLSLLKLGGEWRIVNKIFYGKPYNREAEKAKQAEPPRVIGLGGVFFKSKDPKALSAWYEKHLGLTREKDAGIVLKWRRPDSGAETFTVWGAFPATTKYFEPGGAPIMLNYQVADIDALLAKLKEEGVKIDPKRDDYDYGRFAWIYDLEGNKIELWEPPKSMF